MLCKIADLYVEVPEAGGLATRCQDYRWEGTPNGDGFEIKEELYERDLWPNSPEETISYMESGWLFAMNLIRYNGFRLHASAVEWKGRAYLFSANCGTGKSTHTCLWQQLYSDAAQVFNDDKPALRFLDGRWYAYGTPWCGKDGINQNKKVPLGGICFLEQGKKNSIRRMTPAEVIPKIVDQTPWREHDRGVMIMLLDHIDNLIKRIPVHLLTCLPNAEAAKLSSETMSKAADEAGL